MKRIRVESFSNPSFLCWQLSKNSDFEVTDGGYNQLLPNILNSSSSLYCTSEPPDILILLIDFNGLLGHEFLDFEINSSSKDYFVQSSLQSCDIFVSSLKTCLQQLVSTEIIITLPSIPPQTYNGILDLNYPHAGLISLLESFSSHLTSQLQNLNRITLCSFDHLTRRYGHDHLFDERINTISKSPYSKFGLEIITFYLLSIIDAIYLPTKKVIVCDLDNTLWGGVVGEDGFHGIDLSNEMIGKSYRNFQYHLKCLANQGILLAICSKNNYDDAMQVINNHPYQILREQDFSAIRINWERKDINIQSIADELSLSTDSFVFLDDNPVERELIQQIMPEVCTPSLPKDPCNYSNFLSQIPSLWLTNISSEDLNRVNSYTNNKRRKLLQKNSLSFDDFIDSLSIKISIDTLSKENVVRAHQLIQKTNQFNLSTKRYSLPEVESFMLKSSNYFCYTVKVEDCFENYGIVGFIMFSIESSTLLVDSLLLSCRVLGKQVEDALILELVNHAYALNLSAVQATCISSSKNDIVSSTFNRLNFASKPTLGVANATIFHTMTSQVQPHDRISIISSF